MASYEKVFISYILDSLFVVHEHWEWNSEKDAYFNYNVLKILEMFENMKLITAAYNRICKMVYNEMFFVEKKSG